MKTNDLAQLLNTIPTKITEKSRSTNELTFLLTNILLAMPKDMVEQFMPTALAKYAENAEKINARKKASIDRLKEIKESE